MFSWDTQKAISNYEKHGVPFEEAATLFSDPDQEDEKWQRNDPYHQRTPSEP